MNTVSGRVLLKETGAGVADLLVEVFDVQAESTSTSPLPIGDRLGSVATGSDGSFLIEYTDASIRPRDAAPARPSLLLVVRAPEDMDDAPAEGILHVSKTPRRLAGPAEFYLVRIASKTLSAFGLAAPTVLSVAADEPGAVLEKVQRAVTRKATIRAATIEIAAQQVAAERQRIAEVEGTAVRRLLETLTGVPERLADRLNYVPPGAPVEPAMYRALRKTIEGTINGSGPARGFIVLSPKQAEQFKRPDGTFRDRVPPEEVEPF
jgi:hypothetical protein